MFNRLSPQLVLRSRWRPYRPRPGERVLVLTTGSVFPPGHPATRLCLELLVETLAAAPCPQLLDVGCGSGVLLLAGVAAGAQVGRGGGSLLAGGGHHPEQRPGQWPGRRRAGGPGVHGMSPATPSG